jgi:hypothetical protein
MQLYTISPTYIAKSAAVFCLAFYTLDPLNVNNSWAEAAMRHAAILIAVSPIRNALDYGAALLLPEVAEQKFSDLSTVQPAQVIEALGSVEDSKEEAEAEKQLRSMRYFLALIPRLTVQQQEQKAREALEAEADAAVPQR